MQFCPECKRMTMMYVHGLKEAFCINKKCPNTMKFDTFDDCVDDLEVKEREHRKTSPWGIPQENLVESYVDPVGVLAKEIHEEFSKASITHGIIDEEEYAPYEELPYNVREALMVVARYLDKYYVRR